jgi:hypothetical protein
LLRALGVFDPSDRPRCVGVAWSFGAIERGRAFTAVASTRCAWRGVRGAFTDRGLRASVSARRLGRKV